MDIVRKVTEFWNTFIGVPEFTIGVLVSVLVFAVVYFALISFLLENGSHNLVEIFTLLMIIFAVIVTMISEMDSAIFLLVPVLFLVFIFVIYFFVSY